MSSFYLIILLGFFARVFALSPQDRVIRLEEYLRTHGLLPDDLKPRVNDFTMDQLAALRFASDDELPQRKHTPTIAVARAYGALVPRLPKLQ